MSELKADSGPWVVCRRPVQNATLRLFCFPHAGASGSIFRDWQAGLPGIEVCPIELPGRWTRRQETPLTRISTMAESVAKGIAPLLDRPFAIFGHSLGALVGFEVARCLRRHGLPEPCHLFASGRPAPQVMPPPTYVPMRGLPDHVFLARMVKQYGGIPAAVLQDPDLLRVVLPPTRADMEAVETYEYRPEPPLECPISALFGTNDKSQRLEDVRVWAEQTAAGCEVFEIPGGHFFIDEQRKMVLAKVGAVLGAYAVSDATARPAGRVA